MRNLRVQLNLNMCKVITGKHLCQGLFLSKVASWNPLTVFKCELFIGGGRGGELGLLKNHGRGDQDFLVKTGLGHIGGGLSIEGGG